MNYLRFTIYNLRLVLTLQVKRWLVVFILHSSFFILHLQAQTDSTFHSLDEVQVTGKKITNEVIPPRKLSGEVLQNLSSQSVADAVRFFSGIQVKDYGGVGGLKTVNIRSMGTNQMGVFYDGIQLGNAQNGQIDLGRFSLDNIESISIYNGQKSSALQCAKDYGAAGTIYIQTLRPKFEEKSNFHIITRIKSGSFGLINPSILWQQKVKNLFDISVSTEFLHANGKYKFKFQPNKNIADTILVRKNGDITAIRGEIALFGNVRNGEWKIQFYNYNSERGLPGYIAANVYEHNERLRDNNFFTQGFFKKNFGKYSLLFNAKYANDYTHYVKTHYVQDEIYLSLANSYKPFKIWEIALSADYQYNTLFSNRRDFPFPTRNTLLVALASNVKLKPVKIQASLLGTFVKDKLKIGDAQKPKAVFTPTIMASYSPFHRFPLDFRAFYKRIFRMPTFNDIYYTITTISYLQPEFLQQYDIGAEYIMKKSGKIVKNLNISVDFYYNYVENKIIAVPLKSFFRWQMRNLGKVKIYGVDFSADIEFCLHKDLYLNVLANYSFQDARDFTRKTDTYYGHLIPYAPQNSATLALNFAYKKWRFNYSFLYTGERFWGSDNIADNYFYAFQSHDISAGYTFFVKKSKFSIDLNINNLANVQYEIVRSYPMPRSNFKVALGWEF